MVSGENMGESLEILNKSGFPFQMYIQSLVDQNFNKLKWQNYVSEERWVDSVSKEEGFIDLILRHHTEPIRLVIECKRLEGKWNFLVNYGKNIATPESKILIADTESKKILWLNNGIIPKTVDASFCKLENGEQKKDNRLLEDIAGDLLVGMESFAKKEMEFYIKKIINHPYHQTNLAYIPIIVTTAELQKFIFDPNNFNLEQGRIIAGEAETIPFIRFTKNMATKIEEVRTEDLNRYTDYSKAFDRSVYIVNALHFVEFLESLYVI
jgi:hypothetical protein